MVLLRWLVGFLGSKHFWIADFFIKFDVVNMIKGVNFVYNAFLLVSKFSPSLHSVWNIHCTNYWCLVSILTGREQLPFEPSKVRIRQIYNSDLYFNWFCGLVLLKISVDVVTELSSEQQQTLSKAKSLSKMQRSYDESRRQKLQPQVRKLTEVRKKQLIDILLVLASKNIPTEAVLEC